MRLISFLALSSLATAGVIGCRSDSKNTTDGNTTGDGTGSGGAVKIQDVQNDQMPPGTPVTLHGVVVTAIDNFGAKVGDIWVEEPEGGTYSGVHVFGATTTDVGALAVGDLVDITGAVKDEFAYGGGSNGSGDTSGRTVTELKPASAGSLSVKKVGTGTVPAPVMVDALMIGQISDAPLGPNFSAAWEPYEGVLVSVPHVSAVSSPKAFGKTGAADAYAFNITGVAKVEGNMTDINMSGISRNTCLNMTGVVDYFFDYLVLPRSASDIDTSATGCPAAETSCSDSIDNDGNGFADCADNNCIATDNSCSTVTSIAMLDQAADANPANPTLPMGAVRIAGACVVALDNTSLYIAANGTAANDGGLYAFSTDALPNGVAPGSLVDVAGTAKAFKRTGSTAPEAQLELNTVVVTAATGTCVPAPLLSTTEMSTFATDAGSHKLIGSLVTLTPAQHSFKITTANTAMNKFGTFTEGAATVKFGVSLLPSGTVLGAVNDCFDSITGIWTYDTAGAGSYEILPTSVPTKAATCR